MIAWRRRQQLIFFGYSDAEIARLEDLSKLSNERMNELIHSNNLQTAEKTGDEPNKTALDVRVLALASQDVHVDGFWVKGGSLVHVPAGRVHEVPRVIQEHRMQEARTELLRGMTRH